MEDDIDDISADISSAVATLSGGQNNENQIANLRRQEIATRDEDDVRTPARTAERTSATRQRSEEPLPEDGEQDTDEEAAPEQRQLAAKKDAPAPLPEDKPPVAWRGPLKEKWATLDADVRKEVLRREREIAQTLSRTDQQRQYAENIYNEIAPYEAHLRAENSNHVQAVRHLMQMAHLMRSGTQQQKAELVAELFFRHDVPIQLVDQILIARLQGQPAPADPVRAALQQELAPIRQFMETVQQTRQAQTQQVQAKAQQTFQQLLDDPDMGDFVDDLRDDIADLLDLATKRGQILSLRDAAIRATMAHPEYGPIFNQRQLAKQAQQQSEKANRARRAGASLSNDGAPSASEDDEDNDGSVEADLRSSIRELSRRR